MLESKFIIYRDTVLEVYIIGDFAIPVGQEFKHDTFKKFDNKCDAMYYRFLSEIKNGKPVENFKVSPYYNMYIERLKKDHPEYFIWMK